MWWGFQTAKNISDEIVDIPACFGFGKHEVSFVRGLRMFLKSYINMLFGPQASRAVAHAIEFFNIASGIEKVIDA